MNSGHTHFLQFSLVSDSSNTPIVIAILETTPGLSLSCLYLDPSGVPDLAAMAGSFAFVDAVAANTRQTNDALNGVAGGCAAGFLAGVRCACS